LCQSGEIKCGLFDGRTPLCRTTAVVGLTLEDNGVNEVDSADRCKSKTRAWFEQLQEQIIEAAERLEVEAEGPFAEAGMMPGRFATKVWKRNEPDGREGGGGRMALLSGRVFEKIAVHSSTVFGSFPPGFAAQIPGAEADPRFWASGISLIAHPWNPNVPTVHMNTRFVETTKAWFGGGADLTPMLDRRRQQTDPDTRDFHASMKHACDSHSKVADHEKFKESCDEYFYIKHRNEPRGTGGIFYDYLYCPLGDEEAFAALFAFTREMGTHFLSIYPEIVRRNLSVAWTKVDREEQLIRRGRYAEFNLLYDRGTIFGLNTGGNTEAILSSLPPLARWR
jgi:coproporphyrinogen III oxidase